jgi:hypothetical protein
MIEISIKHVAFGYIRHCQLTAQTSNWAIAKPYAKSMNARSVQSLRSTYSAPV